MNKKTAVQGTAGLQYMVMDMVENILKFADNPGKCGDYITGQIREILGVRLITLFQYSDIEDNESQNLISVCPQRSKKLAFRPEVKQFARLGHNIQKTEIWNSGSCPEKGKVLLADLKFENVVLVPLSVGEEQVGILLLFELMDTKGIDSILESLDRISGVLALVLRNASLYQNLEKRVADRTKDLAESENRFRMLADNFPNHVVRIDREYRFTYVNPAVEKDFGIQANFMVGKTLQEMPERGSPEQTATIMNKVRQVFEEGTSNKIETYWFTESGKRYFETQHVPEEDTAGNIVSALGISRDITEQKQAEEELKESEEKYRTLIKKIQAAVMVHGADTQILTCNEKSQELLGLTEDQLLGKTVIDPAWNFLREDGSVMPVEEYPVNLVLSRRHPLRNYIAGIRRPDVDAVTWVLVNAEPDFDDTGELKQIIVSFVDITERKQAEEALAHSHKLMSYIIEHTRSDVAVHDRDLNYIYVSQSYLRDYKVKEKNVIGKHHYEVFPDLPQQWRDVHQRVLAGDVLSAEDDPYIKDDGTVEWTRWECRPWFEADGTIGGIIVYTEITTERKRAEEALRENEEFLDTVVENIPDMIFIKDAQDLSFVRFNKAGENLLGMGRDELIGKSDYDFFPKEQADFFVQKDKEVLKIGELHDIPEEPIQTKNGERILHTKKIPIYDKNGDPAYLLGISADITERKHAEQERLAHFHFIESMDKINRAIQGTNDVEQMMSDVLDEVLSAFDCDRAWLVYPCDPEAASWSVPMERTKPEYPGANILGEEIPMDNGVREAHKIQLASDGPVKYGPGTDNPLPQDVSEKFGFKCFMSMAVHPKIGSPWQFGMHQCSYARQWTTQEERLFGEIGRRLEDALTSFLAHRDLQKSENRYRIVFENSPVSIWETDFSAVKTFLQDVRKQGIADIESYFTQHPEAVQQCAELINIIDVNRAVFTLHEAASKEELFSNLDKILTPESFVTIIQILVHLWNGETEIAADTVIRTLSGEYRNVTFSFLVCPGCEETLSKALISLIDITERARAEEELKEQMDEINRFNKLMVGREEKMIELKKEINMFLEKEGKPKKYDIFM